MPLIFHEYAEFRFTPRGLRSSFFTQLTTARIAGRPPPRIEVLRYVIRFLLVYYIAVYCNLIAILLALPAD